MYTSSIIATTPPLHLPLYSPQSNPKHPLAHPPLSPIQKRRTTKIHLTLPNPKGFGPSKKPRKRIRKKNQETNSDNDSDSGDDSIDDGQEQGIIPEVVTNRMMSRMGFSVGIPLFTGLMFFPLFYYLKVGLKVDVPTWVPFIVSLFLFGFALLGVSYGIVSSSWDPLREGSVLGWNEARKNWPVFWQSLRGGGDGGDGSRKR